MILPKLNSALSQIQADFRNNTQIQLLAMKSGRMSSILTRKISVQIQADFRNNILRELQI